MLIVLGRVAVAVAEAGSSLWHGRKTIHHDPLPRQPLFLRAAPTWSSNLHSFPPEKAWLAYGGIGLFVTGVSTGLKMILAVFRKELLAAIRSEQHATNNRPQ